MHTQNRLRIPEKLLYIRPKPPSRLKNQEIKTSLNNVAHTTPWW